MQDAMTSTMIACKLMKPLPLPRNCATSLFELVIRDVGGLLAAYDLSGDRMFVTRWVLLGAPGPHVVLAAYIALETCPGKLVCACVSATPARSHTQ